MNGSKAKTMIGFSLALLLGLAGGYALKDTIDDRSIARANELPAKEMKAPPLISRDPLAREIWKITLNPDFIPTDLGMEPLVVPSLFEKGLVMPEVKTIENDNEIQLKADVPGMTEKDIDVEAGKDYVTIKGHRLVEKKDEQTNSVISSEEDFVRTVKLPCQVDAKQVQATVKDGVLTVSLPKLNDIALRPDSEI